MSILIQQLCYQHPDKEPLFHDLNLILNKGEKAALVGDNGSGKSTLLRLISGSVSPLSGEVRAEGDIWYIPQHFGQYNDLTVAQVLGIDQKLNAFYAILKGETSEVYFDQLADDWQIEERCKTSFSFWGIDYIDLQSEMACLSGGEKTKVFLSGIAIHHPEVILLDEPTNHMDLDSREKLYEWIKEVRNTLLVVSHDVTLLNLLDLVYELDKKKGVRRYGGNYDFYRLCKEEELEVLQEKLEEKEKSLRLAKKVARETKERKEKQNVRGKKQVIQQGMPKIMLKTLKDNAEKSSRRMEGEHEDKIEQLNQARKDLYNQLPDTSRLKILFNNSSLHTGKILVTAKEIRYSYGSSDLWDTPLSFQIRSGERWHIQGRNGSGKTTLFKLLMGQLIPGRGEIALAGFDYLYIDQEYSMIENELTVYEQLVRFGEGVQEEQELKTLLVQFLFPYATWNKPCGVLSGGEKMRLLFCCLLARQRTPDLIILDEPTNNLDVKSMEMMISALQDYKGTLLIISHDRHFIESMQITHTFLLKDRER